jgi:hypothetical protein
MPLMFELWSLRRKQAKIEKQVKAEIDEALSSKGPPILDGVISERLRPLVSINEEVREWHTYRLVNEAADLDIELPNEDSAWQPIKAEGRAGKTLSPSGRATLRRLIDEEKTRRREVNAWWWRNVVIPAIAALTGLRPRAFPVGITSWDRCLTLLIAGTGW